MLLSDKFISNTNNSNQEEFTESWELKTGLFINNPVFLLKLERKEERR